MSGRCKCCDAILTPEEMCHKDKHGEYTSLCYSCLYSDYEYTVQEWTDTTVTHKSETYD